MMTYEKAKTVLENCRFNLFPFELFIREPATGGISFSIKMMVKDRDNNLNEIPLWYHQSYYLSELNESLLVLKFFKHLKEMVTHETEEHFYYQNERTFDPHEKKGIKNTLLALEARPILLLQELLQEEFKNDEKKGINNYKIYKLDTY